MISILRRKRLLPLCISFIGALTLPFDAATAQQLGQGTDAADLTLWRFLGALVFILLLVAGAWVVVRSRGGALPFLQNANYRRVKLLEVQRISPQSQICLIEFESTEYLLGVTAQGMTVIDSRSVTCAENQE